MEVVMILLESGKESVKLLQRGMIVLVIPCHVHDLMIHAAEIFQGTLNMTLFPQVSCEHQDVGIWETDLIDPLPYKIRV